MTQYLACHFIHQTIATDNKTIRIHQTHHKKLQMLVDTSRILFHIFRYASPLTLVPGSQNFMRRVIIPPLCLPRVPKQTRKHSYLSPFSRAALVISCLGAENFPILCGKLTNLANSLSRGRGTVGIVYLMLFVSTVFS